MAEFAVRFKSSAAKELELLAEGDLRSVLRRIEALEAAPLPPGCKKLKGAADLWRIRAGDYRVVYSVDTGRRVIEILRIRHRRDVYH